MGGVIMSDKMNKYLVTEMRDEENPEYVFNMTHTRLLIMIANKRLDTVSIAKKQLADRGIGKSGKWVGFDQAKNEWGVK
jgi:hypothetical protein